MRKLLQKLQRLWTLSLKKSAFFASENNGGSLLPALGEKWRAYNGAFLSEGCKLAFFRAPEAALTCEQKNSFNKVSFSLGVISAYYIKLLVRLKYQRLYISESA